jgi:hypothetical protein
MLETNPLFETLQPEGSGHGRGGIWLSDSHTAVYKMKTLKAAAHLSISSSLTAESGAEALVFDKQTAAGATDLLQMTVAEVLNALWMCQRATNTQGFHVTTEPRYRAREMESSQATAFSNLDKIDAHKARLSEPRLLEHFVRYLRLYFRPQYGGSLAARIEALAEMVREESDGERMVSAWSVGYLLGFLERNPSVSEPEVAIGPSGEVGAFWRSNLGEFSARFLPNGTVRYLTSTPNPRHATGFDRSSGDTTPDQLFAKAALRDLSWVIGK